MLKPLRLLIVEDCEDDALILERAVCKSGYDPVTRRVCSSEAMAQALVEESWDIILCDFNLPGFTALDAIALMQMMAIDVPLIVVSGAISEATALECIQRGASDYIMKDNLSRLGLSVAREMEKKALRQKQLETEAALRESEEKYRTILESIGDGYYEVDLAGKFTFVNYALARIWGYPPEDMIGLDGRVYTSPETYRRMFAAHNEVYRTGQPSRLFDQEIIQKSGDIRHIQSSFALLTNATGHPVGFRGVVRDITELKKMENQQQDTLERLRKTLGSTINAIAGMVETRDPYTAGHQRRVADLARAIATEMKLDPGRIDGLRLAGTIHDLGKIAIPSEILTKPTRLTNLEFELVKTHAQAGYDILKDIDFPWPIARMILEHHERMDGSGYPQGLQGDDILLESRILAVADVVEAMASHRPYRPALGAGPALAEIVQNKGRLYDLDAADACLRLFDEKRFDFDVKRRENSLNTQVAPGAL